MKALISIWFVRVTVLAVAIFCFVARGQADVVKGISLGGIYDNNAYASYAEDTDYMTLIQFYIARQTQGSRSDFEIYYTGQGNIFAQTQIRSFSIHRAGLAYAQKLAQGQGNLVVGANMALRLDRSYYNIYDYIGGQGYVRGKWYILPSMPVMMRYRLRVRQYWNLDDFSHIEHEVALQVSKFLPTQTTLRGEVSFGYKDYQDATYSDMDADVPNEGQLLMALQVAQSLGRNTGLSVRYQTRLNTTTDRYFYGETGVYEGDDDLFNDHYDYAGSRWMVRLTQRFGKGLRVVLAGYYEVQNFEARPALDLLGAPVSGDAFRKDRMKSLSLSVEKPLTSKIETWVWYGLETNQSNDDYYNYSGRHNLSVGFDVQF